MQSDLIFSALSNPVRRRLLELMIGGPMTPSALAAQFDLSRSAISEHLAVLRTSGLVREESRGRERIYSLEVTPLFGLSDWLRPFEEYWRERLDTLKTMMVDPE